MILEGRAHKIMREMYEKGTMKFVSLSDIEHNIAMEFIPIKKESQRDQTKAYYKALKIESTTARYTS